MSIHERDIAVGAIVEKCLGEVLQKSRIAHYLQIARQMIDYLLARQNYELGAWS